MKNIIKIYIIYMKNTRVFIISSIVSLITLGYLGVAYMRKGYPSTVPYKLFILVIPVAYGLFGIINKYVIKRFGIEYSLVVGALFGLILSSIGRFVLNLPQLLFNFTKETEYQVHLGAILLYACILRYIITPLTT